MLNFDLAALRLNSKSRKQRRHLLSSACVTFTKADLIIGHKEIFDKFQEVERVQTTFSDHSEIKTENNNKNRTTKTVPPGNVKHYA